MRARRPTIASTSRPSPSRSLPSAAIPRKRATYHWEWSAPVSVTHRVGGPMAGGEGARGSGRPSGALLLTSPIVHDLAADGAGPVDGRHPGPSTLDCTSDW